MKPTAIPTVTPHSTASYAFLAIMALVVVALLGAFLQGGLGAVVSEVGRMLVGAAKR